MHSMGVMGQDQTPARPDHCFFALCTRFSTFMLLIEHSEFVFCCAALPSAMIIMITLFVSH